MISMILMIVLVLCLVAVEFVRPQRPRPRRHRPKPGSPAEPGHGFNRRKPDWVRKEVLRLRALMNEGCRTIAKTFNLLHARRGESVGHSFVAELVKAHHEEILRLRHDIKHRKPRKLPKNLLWALDFTFLPGPEGPRPVLGMIDHGTRLCLALTQLRDRTAIAILRLLLEIFHHFGKPKILRTDNEPIFTSLPFRFGLWLLRVRHQRTTPHCPWQNGRIERIFLTLKERLRRWFDEAGVPDDLTEDLLTVRAWYNHLRPHQHLDGRTPAMVWAGKTKPGRGKARFVSLWNGRLTGFLFPS